MRQYERAGVTIDQCGDCRGIFLDRGELERLIDAETAWHRPVRTPPPPPPGAGYAPTRPYRDYDSDEYPMYGHGYGYRRKKRRSFLEELFD